MFLKIMGGEDKADVDYTKKYKMIEVASFEFYYQHITKPHVAYVDILGQSGYSPIPGNVYVLNDSGKTVETWAPNSKEGK